MGQEYELKYRATEETLRAVQARFPGDWQTLRMETTYYDTASGALEALRCTLRRRMENGVSVCTLKTPAASGVRGEWEVQCDTIQAAIPMLCKLSGLRSLAFLETQPVFATCGAQFTRRALTLALPDCTVEVALDAGVLTGGGRQEPFCELEVELKGGSRGGADAFAAALAEAFSLQIQPLSKFRRALRLTQGE